MSDQEDEYDGVARFTSWCLTIYQKLPNFEELDKTRLRYVITQQEECPETKRLHWQTYVELVDKVSMKTLKRIFKDNKMHCEPRFGTQQQAITYCRKEETRIEGTQFEWGIPSRRGTRSDLQALYEYVESGHSIRETLWMFEEQALRYIRHIQDMQRAILQPSAMDTYVEKYRKRKLTEDEIDNMSSEHAEVAYRMKCMKQAKSRWQKEQNSGD